MEGIMCIAIILGVCGIVIVLISAGFIKHKHGAIACKDCTWFRTPAGCYRYYKCEHPSAFNTKMVYDAADGPMMQQVRWADPDIHKIWNQYCNCKRFSKSEFKEPKVKPNCY